MFWAFQTHLRLSWDSLPSSPLCTFPSAVPHAHIDGSSLLIHGSVLLCYNGFHCAYTPYSLPLTGVQLQSRQSMGLPRANLHSPRGPHSQGNQWLCPSNTFCLLCSLHAAVTPRSFQSQNAYCNSEKSSLHWKYKFKNVWGQ